MREQVLSTTPKIEFSNVKRGGRERRRGDGV